MLNSFFCTGAVPGAVGGAGGGSGGGRPRDENSLSFKHFLQPHSDVVPQPAPTRLRGSRGGFNFN
jgi:hypothetical protein